MSTRNPNQALSEQITKQLLELIEASAEKKIIQAISQGTIRESDWKLLLEEVINRQNKTSDEDK